MRRTNPRGGGGHQACPIQLAPRCPFAASDKENASDADADAYQLMLRRFTRPVDLESLPGFRKPCAGLRPRGAM